MLFEKLFNIKYVEPRLYVYLFGICCSFKFQINKIIYSEIDKNKADFRVAYYLGHNFGNAKRYRVDNIVEALNKKNIATDLYSGDVFKTLIKNKDNYNLLIVFRSGHDDIVLFDKIINTLKIYRQSNIPVIYDVDDLLVDLQTPLNKQSYKLKKRNKITKTIMQNCNILTVSTQYLGEKLKEYIPNYYIIRNTINYKQYEIAQKLNVIPKKFDNKIKIVYQCGTKSHDNDFKVCTNALIKILQRYENVEFHLIGECKIDKRFNQFGNRFKQISQMPYTELLKYVYNMDINIAPLELKKPFNHCKSELKLFESALVKVPSVVSATEPYKAIVKNSINAMIVNNDKEWEEALTILIEDNNLRKTMAEKAYKDFVPMYYIENNIDKIIKLYKQIIN